MQSAIAQATQQGGEIIAGSQRHATPDAPQAAYVRPALVRMTQQTAIVATETFAPILYVMSYSTFDQAISMHNDVPQGLASSIFTTDMREAERFTSANGSDCGIANVNIGPSGAEIGGAFGGEKETGGGRESGNEGCRLRFGIVEPTPWQPLRPVREAHGRLLTVSHLRPHEFGCRHGHVRAP
jgi:aldehyde dehydrogenase (NAD+)